MKKLKTALGITYNYPSATEPKFNTKITDTDSAALLNTQILNGTLHVINNDLMYGFSQSSFHFNRVIQSYSTLLNASGYANIIALREKDIFSSKSSTSSFSGSYIRASSLAPTLTSISNLLESFIFSRSFTTNLNSISYEFANVNRIFTTGIYQNSSSFFYPTIIRAAVIRSSQATTTTITETVNRFSPDYGLAYFAKDSFGLSSSNMYVKVLSPVFDYSDSTQSGFTYFVQKY